MGVSQNLSAPRSEMVRTLYRWWLDNRHDDIPDRNAFQPVDFKRILPNVIISEVKHNPFRIRYRLAGTKVVDATGFNITGRYLDEMLATEPEAPWQEIYQDCYDNRRSFLGTSTCRTTAGGLYTYEFVLCPLRNGGNTIEQFIAVEDYGDLKTTLVDLVQWRERPYIAPTENGVER